MFYSAQKQDIDQILKLLQQVLNVHAEIRPDIFIKDTTKCTKEELEMMLDSPSHPIFVYKENGQVLAHLFLEIQQFHSPNRYSKKELFIEDLCVDENARGKGIGKKCLAFAEQFAKENHCDRICLHAWHGNQKAMDLYMNTGYQIQQYTLEKKI